MDNKIFEHVDTIDAAIFSGDHFIKNKDDAKEMLGYLEKWKIHLESNIELNEEIIEKKVIVEKTNTFIDIEMHTDGSSLGNPGPGGWGLILVYNGTEKEYSDGEKETTNNRMELQAVIEGLKKLKKPCNIKMYSDSKYVLDAIDKWLEGWIAKGWKGSNKKPVKNQDLWKEYVELVKPHNIIEKNWVKGHSGDEMNERCDKLARNAAENIKKTLEKDK